MEGKVGGAAEICPSRHGCKVDGSVVESCFVVVSNKAVGALDVAINTA